MVVVNCWVSTIIHGLRPSLFSIAQDPPSRLKAKDYEPEVVAYFDATKVHEPHQRVGGPG